MSATLEEIVGAVVDPELRVITIAELGILRGVEVADDGRVVVTITPTYSGCPAMGAIRDDIRAALTRAGHPDADIVTKLSPAWSTDLISESGRAALAASGIAPPGTTTAPTAAPRCPRCAGSEVLQISRYGSTACQSLWRCHSCLEPFPAVKNL